MSSKILVFAGSIRKGSINMQLAASLTQALQARGADATHLDLADYPLPIFNGDIEVPENANKLAGLFEESHGLVIVSPEYNSSLTPLLKNTLDWVSVTKSGTVNSFGPYKHKICYLAACSPGGIGGIRGLYHLRSVLMNVGAEIVTPQLAVGNGNTAFEDDGSIKDDRTRTIMEAGIDDFLYHVKHRAVPASDLKQSNG